jgi:hypothetical protein
MHRLFTLFILILSWPILSTGQSRTIDSLCADPGFHQSIRNYWHDLRPSVLSTLLESQAETYNLYHTHEAVNLLLWYAFNQNDKALIDDVLMVVLESLGTTDTIDRYFFRFADAETGRDSLLRLSNTAVMWVDGTDSAAPKEEDILSSSLFLSMVAQTVFRIARIPDPWRSPIMTVFVKRFGPVLSSHYSRWVIGATLIDADGNISQVGAGPFQRRSWGCRYLDQTSPAMMTHAELIDHIMYESLASEPSARYCNAVTDVDLFIMSGVSDLVAAYLTDSTLVQRPENLDHLLYRYLPKANFMVTDRLVATELTDWSGATVAGAVFDKGHWDEHPDHRYAGNDQIFIDPDSLLPVIARGTGWDISHGRRFVTTYQSFFDNREILGFTRPDCNDMRSLADQFIYGVYNGDSVLPLFSNYMDGANGWYRVGYQKRPHFGYGPSDLSIAAITGGFGMWSQFRPGIKRLMGYLYNMLISGNPGVRQHVITHYEMNHWQSDSLGTAATRPDEYEFVFPITDLWTKRDLLRFYCSMCIDPNSDCTLPVTDVDRAIDDVPVDVRTSPTE